MVKKKKEREIERKQRKTTKRKGVRKGKRNKG